VAREAGGAEGVALAFARDRAGRMVAAAALDAATRRSRAPFTCPGCGDELVARLGAVRARHFAHRPGSDCPLTAPETALHFNAKARLLELCALAFAGERAVRVRTRCGACRRPVVRDLATAGDAAAGEAAVAGRRADVLVTRRGAPALAIEVQVTHAVEPEKAAALGALGVPVVELDARADWETESPEGVIELRCFGSSGLPACRACLTERLAEADRALGGEAAQVAELESYRARGLLRLDAVAGGSARTRARHDRVNRNKLSMLADSVPESFQDDPRSSRRAEGASRPFAALAARFHCPDCGGLELELGPRLAAHACPVHGARAVAWVGYDGRLAVLGWWKR
jgi:predicted RNA-binding Zn-ribbon protein involved in translation (DUF1610 family)